MVYYSKQNEGGEGMPMRYKVDILAALKEKGYNTTRIRRNKIIGEQMLTKIRNGEMCSWAVMCKLCELLQCQPGDLVEYRKD